MTLTNMKNTITSFISTECPWRDTLYWYPTTDSTNTRAKKLAENGAPHGTVVIAGHQTQGRGRMGRSFHSPESGGIYMSVILRPNCTPTKLMHLTCAVAVAMCDAVASATGFRPGVKWINDLVANQKKLGGVLTELSVNPKTHLVDYAVVGIGINCSQEQKDFPEELQEIAISLKTAAGANPSIPHLAAAMVKALWEMDKLLLCQKDAIMSRYRQDCITFGKEVVLLRADTQQYGTALDIDDDGQLLVQFQDGRTEYVNSGEVSCRGTYGYLPQEN